MKKKSFRLFLLSVGIAVAGHSQSIVQSEVDNQSDSQTDTASITKLLDKSKESLNESPDKAIALAQQAKDLSEKAGFKKGKAYALKNIGLGYYYQGKYI